MLQGQDSVESSGRLHLQRYADHDNDEKLRGCNETASPLLFLRLGLYKCIKFWYKEGQSGFKVCKYAFVRLEMQDPLPLLFEKGNTEAGSSDGEDEQPWRTSPSCVKSACRCERSEVEVEHLATAASHGTQISPRRAEKGLIRGTRCSPGLTSDRKAGRESRSLPGRDEAR